VLQKALRWALRLAAILVAVGASLLLAFELATRQHTRQLQDPITALDDVGLLPLCSDDDGPVAHMSLHRLDVTRGTIDADTTLCFPEGFLEDLRENSVYEPTLFIHHASRLVVRKRFRRLAIRVVVDGGEAGRIIRRIALADLHPSTDLGVATYSVPGVRLPIDGYPQDFPLDNYSFGATVLLRAPTGTITHHQGSTSYGVGAEARIVPVVQPDLTGYTIRASAHDAFGGYLRASAARAPMISTFAGLLSLIPLLLIGALVAVVLSPGHRTSRVDLLVGGAAILLAVLPIRSVLVPSDVSSVTLVDLVLGWEVALLTLLTVWVATTLLADLRVER
jgi:hypothetical protein